MNNWKDYTVSYDGLSYTPQQKARIAAQAAAAAGKSRRNAPRKQFFLGRIAAAAACLLSVITVTAEAAGIPTPVSELLSPIFGGTVAQTEVIDQIGRPIQASDTDNGITISADAIIGDEYNACIVFTIRRDDGTALLPEGVTANQLMQGGSTGVELVKMGSTHGSSRFLDTVPGDEEIQWIRYISSDVPLNRGTCKASFKDISYWSEEENGLVPVLEGSWKFRFEVDYADTSLLLGNGETFQQEGMTFTITGVRVSPIAVQVSYEVDSQVQWSDAPSGRLPEEDRRQAERYMENVQILLTKKDGTVLDMSNSGGRIQPGDGKTYCTKGDLLEEVVPLEELESVTVGGVCYPIGVS